MLIGYASTINGHYIYFCELLIPSACKWVLVIKDVKLIKHRMPLITSIAQQITSDRISSTLIVNITLYAMKIRISFVVLNNSGSGHQN